MIFDGAEVKVGDKKNHLNKNKKVVGTTTILEIDEAAETIKTQTDLIDGTTATMTIHVPTSNILESSVVKPKK